jgi:hypothetical protein
MERVLVGLQGNSSRSLSSSFLAWVPGEYTRQTLLRSSGEPKVSNPWNNVQRKDSI